MLAARSFKPDEWLGDPRPIIIKPNSEPPLSDWRAAIDNRLLPNGNPQKLNLTDNEKQQIIAFLQTLTGANVYTDEKLSDPF